MKKAVIVGSGAGGAAIARELQGKFQVTILEAGNSFRPLSVNLSLMEKVKKTSLLFDERQIQWIFPAMKIRKAGDNMVLVNGVGQGGTTTLSAGNAVRHDQDLKNIGIDLEAEFRELYRQIPVSSEHHKKWRPATQEIYSICQDLHFQPQPTPKLVRLERCTNCGKCVLGCAYGAKWDSREYLNQAVRAGAELISGCKVQKVVIEKGKAAGAAAVVGKQYRFYPADLVVLAAGGFGTPAVLQQSGIQCRASLFVDPVLCVAVLWEKARQNREISMPFFLQKENFMISPYFDFLSYFFNRRWKYPATDIFSLMIKLSDEGCGTLSGSKVKKALTEKDKASLKEGVRLCREIFIKAGKKETDFFLGTINAGHPGGMLPLTEKESKTLHHHSLPPNLYVSDASLFPHSLGNPPILTIMALAKRIGKVCCEIGG